MYPVHGPLTSLNPVPVIDAKINSTGSKGDVSFMLPDGTQCAGKWSLAANEVNGGVPGAEVHFAAGASHGVAAGSCSNNATFQMDFNVGTDGSSGNGTAEDSMGNTYRVLF